MSLNSVTTTDSQNPQILGNAGSSHFDVARSCCLNQPAALLLVHIAKHSRKSGHWGFCTNYILETLPDNTVGHDFRHGLNHAMVEALPIPVLEVTEREQHPSERPRTWPRHQTSDICLLSYKLQYE